MKPVKQVDLVVMRVWEDGRDSDVFALFPEIASDSRGDFCSCYQRVGQHSAADYYHCIKQSRPATKKESAPLLKELRLIGYNPLIIQRTSPKMHEQRALDAQRAV